jgi:hypothetical protein
MFLYLQACVSIKVGFASELQEQFYLIFVYISLVGYIGISWKDIDKDMQKIAYIICLSGRQFFHG